MTKNRIMEYKSVTARPKILVLYRMSKIDFQPEFWNAMMLSFLMMFNTMGSKVDGLPVREHFL